MAVYCGVCAGRIGSAPDNGGSFQVTSEFQGWSSRISDTCESCAKTLRAAVTKAANKLVAKHRRAVDALKREVEVDDAHQKRVAEERRAFEHEWAARKSKIISEKKTT